MTSLSEKELLEALELANQENQRLKAELHETNLQLHAVNQKLDESERFKTNFLSNIRNEIINPFTAVIGLAQSIDKIKYEDWPKAKQMANLISEEAFVLDFEFKNIFAAAEIEAGEAFPEYNAVNVNKLVKDVLQSMQHFLVSREIKIYLCPDQHSSEKKDLYSKTDPSKLTLILLNLIHNAVTYSVNGNTIIIKIEQENKDLRISVQDSGAGINPDFKDKIFDRFTQLQTGTDKPFKGLGLGLSVVKGYLDILAGEIKSINNHREGSTFIVSLPGQLFETELREDDCSEFLFEV